MSLKPGDRGSYNGNYNQALNVRRLNTLAAGKVAPPSKAGTPLPDKGRLKSRPSHSGGRSRTR